MPTLVDKYFSEADLDAIQQAVTAAEKKSSGELAIKLAPQSRSWLLERVVVSSLAAVVCLVVSLYLTKESNWGTYLNFTQGALWSIIGFLAGYFGLGKLLKSESRRRRAVWNNALHLFYKLKPTRGHTGVLILVSLEEEQAAVIADVAIATKVPKDYWDEPHAMIMEGIRAGRHAEGMVQAVTAIGNELARFFPHHDDDRNELPDRPQIIE
ncbi:MAG: hypothetical protein AB1644_05600 [Candidatus Zixiibacteriota bacterium]